jgi:Protein of unknown function (DUF3631)
MTVPPPSVCRRIKKKLHALLGSPNEGERNAAYKKLSSLLIEHSLTWNDIPEVLAIAAEDARSAEGARAPSQPTPPSDAPADVNPLDLLLVLIERHIAVSPEERMAIALWILHVPVYDKFKVTPRLALMSPVRGCGKTTVLLLIEKLVARPWRVDDLTPAALYRYLDHTLNACLLVDEADNADLLHSSALRKIFNSGHLRGGCVSRVDRGRSRRFPTFAPLALGGIGMLPLPLMHRSVVINMQRAPEDAPIEPLEDGPEFVATRDLIRKWATTCQLTPRPDVPLRNRPADNWRVLLSIADSLGHSVDARAAAVALSKDRPDEDAGVVLLTDIRGVFGKLDTDRIKSEELVKELPALNDYWLDWRDDRPGRKLTQGDVARLLRPFGIRSKSIWPAHRGAGSSSRKGYTRDQFEDAWRSYCGAGTAAHPRKNIRLVGS